MRSLFLFCSYIIVLVALIGTHRREGVVSALSELGLLQQRNEDECLLTFPARLHGGTSVYGCKSEKNEGELKLSLTTDGLLSLSLAANILWKAAPSFMRRPISNDYFAEIRNEAYLVIGRNETVLWTKHLSQCKPLLSHLRLESQDKNDTLASIAKQAAKKKNSIAP
uniref:Uncharacterized protein n=1 Tax=Aureoumbra lagunensis TaxID=44058 RepID=A0A7S3JZM5_9STRA